MTSYTANYNIPKPDGTDPVAAINTAMDVVDSVMAARQAEIDASGRWPKQAIVWDTDEARISEAGYLGGLARSNILLMRDIPIGKYFIFLDLHLKGTGVIPSLSWGFYKQNIAAYMGGYGPFVGMDANGEGTKFYTAAFKHTTTTYTMVDCGTEYMPVGNGAKVSFVGYLDVVAATNRFELWWACFSSTAGDRLDIKAGSYMEYRRVA